MTYGASTASIGGVILAAGSSTRFGSPKQLVEIDGEPLLLRVARQVCGARCARIGVVLGASAAQISKVLADLPVDRIDNPRWAEGVSSSIGAGVSWARAHGMNALLLSVADQPGLETSHVDALLAASQGGRRLAASFYAGTLGVPAVFPSFAFPALLALRGDVGARAILRDSRGDVVAVPWGAGALDVDSLADLAGGWGHRDLGPPGRRG